MRTVFIPRLIDACNTNAQALNTKAMLSRWQLDRFTVRCPYYHRPDPKVDGKPGVEAFRLWRGRAFQARLLLAYLEAADLIFYPNATRVDIYGLRLLRALRSKVRVVATLEGLVGDSQREREYSEWAGHPVYCQPVGQRQLAWCDEVLETADHVIAVSPFLARMGARRYGEKFSELPLGVDSSVFYPGGHARDARPLVVSAGRLGPHKRPELFLELARRHPEADFKWFGEGEMREELEAVIRRQGIMNFEFPGEVSQENLAKAFRAANLFVFPSRAEGAPKVVTEAVASGLPVVIFGFYETSIVKNGDNGRVVWSDEQFLKESGKLIEDLSLTGSYGIENMAVKQCMDWDFLAPEWEKLLNSQLV